MTVAEVVSIGTELLLGDAVDTNSAWIGARLAEIGVDVHRHTTVGDNVERIAAVLREACARADAVIVTGGLGPTQDDLTRDAVALVAGVPLERRAELVDYVSEFFASRGREMPERNLVQADLPAGATVLPPVGTAAGFTLEVAGTVVACVPGVPGEMQVMVERDVIPDLASRTGAAVTVSRLVRTAGMSESGVAEICADLVQRLDRAEGTSVPTVAFLASRGETRVRITAKGPTRAEAVAATQPVVDEVVALLGDGVAGVDDEGVEHAVARALRRRGWTLGVAESMSGGNLAARLVRVAGASAWFRGSLVTYATEAKGTVAGIDPALIERCGPVSEEVARELAVGASEALHADVGLGITGVAGPATQGGRPVGTVVLGCVLPSGRATTRTVELPVRGRVELQEWSASIALDYLRRRLAEEPA